MKKFPNVTFHKVKYYVNGLPARVKATRLLQKLYIKISTLADCEALEDRPSRLAVWAQTWLLNCSAIKCVVLK